VAVVADRLVRSQFLQPVVVVLVEPRLIVVNEHREWIILDAVVVDEALAFYSSVMARPSSVPLLRRFKDRM
jgi:hypothetical protein